jgi:hypothetical protein
VVNNFESNTYYGVSYSIQRKTYNLRISIFSIELEVMNIFEYFLCDYGILINKGLIRVRVKKKSPQVQL